MTSRLLKGRDVALFAASVIAASSVGGGDAAAVERSPGWGQYRDKEAGLTFDLPVHIFPLDSAKEGRPGTVFSSSDGRASARVFSMSNDANDPPRKYLARIANPDAATFTYVRTAPTFFVASGTQEGRIFYRRCNFFRAEKRIGCLQLDYPQQEKRAWDAAVTRMSHSLRLMPRD